MALSDGAETEEVTGDASQPRVPRIPWIGDKLFYGWVVVFVGAATQFAGHNQPGLHDVPRAAAA